MSLATGNQTPGEKENAGHQIENQAPGEMAEETYGSMAALSNRGSAGSDYLVMFPDTGVAVSLAVIWSQSKAGNFRMQRGLFCVLEPMVQGRILAPTK